MEKASQRPASGTNNGPASDDDRNPNPNTNTNSNSTARDNMVKDDGKTKTGKKTLWVDVQKCFNCGKHGHRLPKCTQCSQAFYCDSDCQRKHWQKHKPVCRAAVAALARHATRERLARAVRTKGKEEVEGGDQDDLCVICQAKPVDPVEVSWILMHICRIWWGLLAVHVLTHGASCSLTCVFATPLLATAPVWPRVLQVVHGGAAPQRRGQVMPPLPQAAPARAGSAV